MKTVHGSVVALSIVLLGALSAGAAEPKPAPTPAKKQSSKPPAPPPIAPEAVAAVDRMGAYLKTLATYSVHVDTATDEVLEAGPKVQFGGTMDIDVRSPNGFHLTWSGDRQKGAEYFYDGSSVTVYGRDQNVWASVPAPLGLEKMLDEIRGKYEIDLPLDDLVRGAQSGTLLDDVKAGILVGTGRVAGVECDHVGFHSDGYDWQLWIEKGDRPLPRKLVITTLTEPSQPQHSEVITWNLTPKLEDATFKFVAPKDAERIVIAEKKAAAPSTKKAAAKKAPAKTEVKK